jgi:hypothetical protein
MPEQPYCWDPSQILWLLLFELIFKVLIFSSFCFYRCRKYFTKLTRIEQDEIPAICVFTNGPSPQEDEEEHHQQQQDWEKGEIQKTQEQQEDEENEATSPKEKELAEFQSDGFDLCGNSYAFERSFYRKEYPRCFTAV